MTVVLWVLATLAFLVIYCLVGLLFLRLVDFVWDETGLAMWIAEGVYDLKLLLTAFWPVVFVAWILTILFSIPYFAAYKILSLFGDEWI